MSLVVVGCDANPCQQCLPPDNVMDVYKCVCNNANVTGDDCQGREMYLHQWYIRREGEYRKLCMWAESNVTSSIAHVTCFE